MKVIGYLSALDRLFGVPVTTRNWNTITAIAKALDRGAARSTAASRPSHVARYAFTRSPAVDYNLR